MSEISLADILASQNAFLEAMKSEFQTMREEIRRVEVATDDAIAQNREAVAIQYLNTTAVVGGIIHETHPPNPDTNSSTPPEITLDDILINQNDILAAVYEMGREFRNSIRGTVAAEDDDTQSLIAVSPNERFHTFGAQRVVTEETIADEDIFVETSATLEEKLLQLSTSASEEPGDFDYLQQQPSPHGFRLAIAAAMESVSTAAEGIDKLTDWCFAMANDISERCSDSGVPLVSELQDVAVLVEADTSDGVAEGNFPNLSALSPVPPSPPVAEMPDATSTPACNNAVNPIVDLSPSTAYPTVGISDDRVVATPPTAVTEVGDGSFSRGERRGLVRSSCSEHLDPGTEPSVIVIPSTIEAPPGTPSKAMHASPVAAAVTSSRTAEIAPTVDAVSPQTITIASAVMPPAQTPASSTVLSVTPVCTDMTQKTSTGAESRSPNVNNSLAAMPMTPIPPPPPLATVARHPKRPPLTLLPQLQHRSRSAVSKATKQRERRPEDGLEQRALRQGEGSLTSTPAAMPQSTDTQQSSPPSPPPSRAVRTHPHPTRRRSKGRGAAARRKERRRVADPPGSSPVFSSSLRPHAPPFVPCSTLPQPIPVVAHVIHWFQNLGFPWWSPTDGLDWPLPYLYW